jgi:hypothetical protein
MQKIVSRKKINWIRILLRIFRNTLPDIQITVFQKIATTVAFRFKASVVSSSDSSYEAIPFSREGMLGHV